VDHLAHCDALEVEIAFFADVLGASDVHRPVPSCPEWDIAGLAGHLGGVHRWAEHLVRHLAHARNASPAMWADDGPVDAAWIRDGGARLLTTLRSTDPNLEMWAWGADQHVRFWSRRQLHETLVHRIDLELANGLQPHTDDEVAADAIDEFLVNLPAAARFSPRIAELRGLAGRVAFRDARTGRHWTVSSRPDGAGLSADAGPVDATMTADGLDLLLALYRRRSLEDVECVVDGDAALLRVWLDHLALE
jgi:uncharacterized protein (TIGR03083 family)